MKKIISTFLFLLFFTVTSMAQLPPYYNYNTNGTNNSFPFNIATGKKVQYLYLPGEFNTPSPAPSGNITNWWFRIADTYPLTSTYTGFYIKMGRTNLTALPSGGWYTGTLDTVFYRASGFTINAAVSTWFNFTLDRPFAYRNDSSLVIEIGQCTSSQGTGFSTCLTTVSAIRRSYGGDNCSNTYIGQQTNVINSGITVVTLPPLPDLIYYKFENNPSATTVLNCAIPGVGNNPATLTPPPNLGSGGQFDSCLVGTGGTGAVASGWNCDLAAGNWTISFWVQNLIETSGGSPCYLFGDPGSTTFRCFYGGAALPNNMLLRGPLTDILIPCPMPGTYTFHFVYNGTNVIIYRNGALISTNPRTISMPTGTGFRVGGYNNTSFSLNGKMDEFRIYRRALDTAEISASWNTDLGGCSVPVGISGNNNQVPKSYVLMQNFPNPFNPTTKIEYALPKSGSVSLVVFDLLGREVAVLVNGYQKAGAYDIDFDASALSSGVYFYRISAGEFKDTKKMLLIK